MYFSLSALIPSCPLQATHDHYEVGMQAKMKVLQRQSKILFLTEGTSEGLGWCLGCNEKVRARHVHA